jgi:hypothetical protein
MTICFRTTVALCVATVLLSCHGREADRGAPGLYRKIVPIDLCMEREVFTGPSKDTLAGRLGEESTAYRESATEAPRSAISFSIWVEDGRLDIWREKTVVMSWYVLKDKRYDECSWIASPAPMSFGPNDVKASTRIEQTGPGRWKIFAAASAPNS